MVNVAELIANCLIKLLSVSAGRKKARIANRNAREDV
jgi:hypothetical protein